MYKWNRRVNVGESYYEVSTKGDKRYSALVAKLKDGRTIEEAYQLDVKGYRVHGNDWTLGKGKPPLSTMSEKELYHKYKNLWITFFNENTNLFKEISIKAQDTTLTDMFAKTNINQARAICDILNNNGDNNMKLDTADILKFKELSLYKDNKANRVSTLNWSMRGKYPRITVFINGGDRSVVGKDNMIIAPMTMLGINDLMTAMKSISDLKTPNNTVYEISCYNSKYVDNKRTDETYVQATIVIGKDENGVSYIALKAADRPLVKFMFRSPKKWFKTTKNGVDIYSTPEGSAGFASNYLEQIKFACNDLIKENSELYKPDNTVL